ncbi:hypothetical protein Sarmat_00947 [Rickettsiales endosymbiont of Paramecium tredecaurelia]|nr:hypothetical protein [Candidatus Sarmatiella mevalonica]
MIILFCLFLICNANVFANNQVVDSGVLSSMDKDKQMQSSLNHQQSLQHDDSAFAPPYDLTVLGLYIQGAGGNSTEAEINAHELGMRRAILLLIDKLGIGQSALNPEDLSYEALKTVFTPINVELGDSTNLSYSALVDYRYRLDSLYKIIYNNSNQKVQDLFHSYAVIPIIKRGAMMHIADNSIDSQIKWDKYWMMVKNIFEEQGLLIMFSSHFPPGFSAQNVLNATYNDALMAFYPKLIKGVIFVVIEYFTDFSNGAASLKSIYKVQEFDKPLNNFEQTFSLSSAVDDVTIANSIMHYLIQNYGLSSSDDNSKEDAYSTLDIIFNNDLKTAIANDDYSKLKSQIPHDIKLFVNLRTAEELKQIQQTLVSIHFIKKIEVDLDNTKKPDLRGGINYCITITISGGEDELVEALYNFKWSMERINEESFNLNKIDDGGI